MAIRRPVEEPCTVEGCALPRRSKSGLHCRKHADRLRRHGSLEDAPAKRSESVRSGAHTSAPAAHTAIVTALPTSSGRATAQQRARGRVRPSVRADGSLGGFELPEGVLPKGQDWHSRTRAWWESWRASPQASRMMTEPDWDYLLDTALLHHGMWTSGRWDLAAEVRQRVAAFGATPADRVRLRFEIEVPEGAPAGTAGSSSTPSRIDHARDRWATGTTTTTASASPARREPEAPPRAPVRTVPVVEDDRTLEEIRAALNAHGLPVTGPRRALVARLHAVEDRSTGTADAAPFDLT